MKTQEQGKLLSSALQKLTVLELDNLYKIIHEPYKNHDLIIELSGWIQGTIDSIIGTDNLK